MSGGTAEPEGWMASVTRFCALLQLAQDRTDLAIPTFFYKACLL